METRYASLEVIGSVALLTLKVPPINALDESALGDLAAAVSEAENDDHIRSVLITSGIDGIFCAGGDLKFWPRAYPDQAATVSELGRKVFDGIEQLSKPTIAAIQGRVIGDGLSLALACDIRLAAEDASFRLPELDYGFIPGWGTIGRLVDIIGKAGASELLLLGEELGAVPAQAMGLVHQVYPARDLLPAAKARAEKLAGKPPLAVRSAKSALTGNDADTSRRRRQWESSCFCSVWGGQEWQDGIDRLFRGKA